MDHFGSMVEPDGDHAFNIKSPHYPNYNVGFTVGSDLRSGEPIFTQSRNGMGGRVRNTAEMMTLLEHFQNGTMGVSENRN